MEGIRCSSAILTDTECPEEQQTDKQAIRKDGAFSPAHIYYCHSTGLKETSLSLSSLPTSQGLILFRRETHSPALRFPPFLYLQSDCSPETIGELP